MFPSASEMLPYIQIIAGSATGLGFFFTYLTFKRVRITEETKLAEKVHDSLNTIDKELAEIKKRDKDKISIWDGRLYNTWEWYSFLVNEKRITDKKIIDYFQDGIIHDFEEKFLINATEEEKTDPLQYPEFKKLYKQLKVKKPTSTTS